MEYLESIIPFIDRDRFVKDVGSGSQLFSLFDLISSRGHIDETEAQIALYGSPNKEVAFKKLKQRLRDRINGYITKHGIPAKNLDSYSLLYRKCIQQVFAVRTLVLSNARGAASVIAENVLKTTIKNEFTDLSMMLSADLAFYYSNMKYNPVKARRFTDLTDQMRELYCREQIATSYYSNLRLIFRTSRASHKEKHLNQAIEYANHLQNFLDEELSSYQLLLMSYLVMAMRYELENDYRALLNLCNTAIETFSNRKITRDVAPYLFDVRRITCFIQFRQYEEAEMTANKYLPRMNTNDLNWFVLKAYILLNRLHARNYEGAFQILSEVKDNKAYKKLPPTTAQTWYIFEAHIYFLASVGKVTSKGRADMNFKVYKFLNDIPMFSKDKRGLNISALIMHVLILLQQGKRGEIIDRVDALNQYCHRYLKNDDTFRSNCFIKMLLKIVKAEFNKIRTIRYARPLVSKLSTTPFMMTDQNIEVEIIPYEDLWEITLQLLD